MKNNKLTYSYDDINLYTSMVEKKLKKSRFLHTLGTIKVATELAEIYGVSREKAHVAALFHDYGKCIANDDLRDYINKNNMNIDEVTSRNIELAHGLVGAHLLEKEIDNIDKEVLSAIIYHTTGKTNMSILEKIIYLSDAIEQSREYNGVDDIRKIAKIDLDKAIIMSVESTLKHVKELGYEVHPRSIQMKDELLKGKRSLKMDNMKDLALEICDLMDDRKAEDIVGLEVGEISSLADYFIIASASNERQVAAIAEHVEDELSKRGIEPSHKEGFASKRWVILDYTDIIVHVFHKEEREYYNIERIWSDAKKLEI